MEVSVFSNINPEMATLSFLAIIYLFTFVFGNLLEKIRVPWIFSALLLGVGLSTLDISKTPNYDTFQFLAELGMYFMLFLIGFEIDLKDLMNKKGYMIRSTATIITLEGILGSLLIHFVFGYNWLISGLVAVSFATVGEAMLLPILDEFGVIHTDLGQTIIGIGVVDDAVEILTIIIASILLGSAAGTHHVNTGIAILTLAVIFIMTYGLSILQEEGRRLEVLTLEDTFLFVIFIFFLFLSIGFIAEAAALGAVLSGIAVKNFLPEKRRESIESEIKSVAYGLFGPLFFVWVGAETNPSYMFSNPLLVLLVIFVANASKMLGSYIVGRRRLGLKKSLIMGVSLSVRFSTSIVIIKLLHDAGVIQTGLYSVLIATTIAFKFLVPFLLSYMFSNWDIGE